MYRPMKVACDPTNRDRISILQRVIDRGREREADELGYYLSIKRAVKKRPKSSLINKVVITPVGYYCNLSCDYCFNKPENEQSQRLEVMSDEVLERTIREVTGMAENPEFVWHGGEPLLAGIEFYQKVLVLQQKHGRSSATARNIIQTNGTLINEKWAKFFQENNFKIGISLDGPQKIHNAHRKYPSKKGSFSDVVRAIEILSKQGNLPGIIAVISEKNSISAEDLLDFFIRENVPGVNVNPGIKELKASTYTFYADFMCRLFDAWIASKKAEFQIKLFEELIKTFLGISSGICWLNANCSQIIRIDRTGDVWPCCDRYLPFEQYKFGNILQSSLAEILAGEISKNFRDTFSLLPSRCINCEWNHICKGGCSYHRLMSGQGKDGEDPLCQANKQIFRHIYKKCQKIYNQTHNA